MPSLPLWICLIDFCRLSPHDLVSFQVYKLKKLMIPSFFVYLFCLAFFFFFFLLLLLLAVLLGREETSDMSYLWQTLWHSLREFKGYQRHLIRYLKFASIFCWLKLSQIESNIGIACSKNLNKCQNFSLSMDLIL